MAANRVRLVVVPAVVLLAVLAALLWWPSGSRRCEGVKVVVQDAFGMCWSKDGRYLLYSKDGRIYRYDVRDGSRQAYSVDGNDGFDDVSPDGESVVWSDYLQVRADRNWGKWCLLTTRLGSGKTRKIYVARASYISNCWWLPDGRILFAMYPDAPGSASVTCLINPDGSNLVQLAKNKYPEVYSVDGTTFLYRRRLREYRIFDIETGRERSLIFPGRVYPGDSFQYLSKTRLVCYGYWRKWGRKSVKKTLEMLDLETGKWTQLDLPIVSQTAQISPTLTHYWVHNFTGRTDSAPPISYYLVEIPRDIQAKLAGRKLP